MMEHQENHAEQTEQNVEIQIADIISATKIMEFAISQNIFTTKQLMEITPVVVRFQEFSEKVQALQEEQRLIEEAAAKAEEQPTPENGGE